MHCERRDHHGRLLRFDLGQQRYEFFGQGELVKRLDHRVEAYEGVDFDAQHCRAREDAGDLGEESLFDGLELMRQSTVMNGRGRDARCSRVILRVLGRPSTPFRAPSDSRYRVRDTRAASPRRGRRRECTSAETTASCRGVQ